MHPGEPEAPLPPEGGLFESVFTTDELSAATSDRAWVAAMIDFEAALAVAEAKVGLVPLKAADAYSGPAGRSTWTPSPWPGRTARL